MSGAVDVQLASAGDPVRSGPAGRYRDLVPRVTAELGAQGGHCRPLGGLSGGPPAGPGIRCPGSSTSSGPKVATAGGQAGEPVLQVAPGPVPGSGPPGHPRARRPRWLLPAAGWVFRWAPGRRRGAEGPGWWWGFVGVHAEYGIPGRRRARRPEWPLPAAGRVIRCSSGRRRAQGPGWPLPVAGQVNRCCRWPRAAAGSAPRVATGGGWVIRWGGGPSGRRRDPVPWVVDELGAQGGHCRPPGG